ncbi:vomeronasal type-1 receptor 2-like [Tamandua tetradactyla]|uniref:vomeronasal type-1 receptor 2-like n=1 Tax=Tamandua tetradactyla TaxID=48850 RepID=UPI004053E256
MNLEIGIIFLLQIVLGILGNFSLLYHFVYIYFNGYRSRSTDLCIRHLTVANSLVILSRGIPQTMAAFGLKQSSNDFGCMLVFYVHRVSRSVSIGTTCLLSIFQAITISLINSRWKELKLKALKYVSHSNILCWIVHIFVNIIFPIYITVKLTNENSTENNFGYCSVPNQDKVSESLYVALLSCHDVVCLGLMTWASSFMVFLLYRHKQRVQYIHRNNLSHRCTPESKAIQSILALVISLVSFYTLSYISYVYLALFKNHNVWLVNFSAIIAACFPTVSPFIFISLDSTVSRFCCVCWGMNSEVHNLI